MKTFIREIPADKWTDELDRQYSDCEKKYKADSVEIWYINETLEAKAA